MVKKIISELHDLTLTPTSKDISFYCSCLSDSVDAVSCERSILFPSFLEDDVRAFILFMLEFADSPPNLRGILKIQAPLRFLLNFFLCEATEDEAVQKEFLSLLDRWFEYLRNSVPSDLMILDKRPLIKDSSLLFFHFATFNRSLLKNGTLPFYSTYAPRLHVEIRAYKRKDPSQNAYESAVRAARYFFIYMPDEIIQLPTHPEKLPPQYVSLFLANLEKKKVEDIEALKKIYARLFKQLTQGAPVRRKQNSGRMGKKKYGRAKNVQAVPVAIIPENEDEIEFLGAADFILADPGEVAVAKKPLLSRTYMDTINTRNHAFWWDKAALKLDELHSVYRACMTHWGRSEEIDRIILHIFLLLHTGYDAAKLLELTSFVSGTPRVQKINGQLYFVINSPLIREYKESVQNCLTSSDEVYLPMPLKLARLMEAKMMKPSTRLFDYVTATGNIQTLKPHHTARFIKEEINKKTGFHITLSRIENSFPTLYCNRFGLDPIYGCYTSGSNVQNLYLSQLHYIYVDAATLASEYLKAFQKVDSSIIAAAYFKEDREILQDEMYKNYCLFFKPDSSAPPKHLPVTGYGSPRVPSLTIMKDKIKELKRSIEDAKTVITLHNFYICYAYLCLEFCGGMRPRNKPDEEVVAFIKDYELAILKDKRSPLFSEERIISLPKTALVIISKLEAGFPRLKTLLASNVNPSFLTVVAKELFFFLDDAGHKINFTLEKFNDLMRKATGAFNFPANAARHYLKTYLHKKSISIDVSDAWLGHSHAGRESLNLVSSILPYATFAGCVKVVEEMLLDLGFEGIPYLDGGK